MAISTRSIGNGQGRPQAIADINVTPLVDVMLVLLIVFMVTAPMLAAGLRVQLPQARAAMPQDPKQPIIVTIAPDGQLALGKDPVPRERLVGMVRHLLAGEDRPIHLRGDRDASYGDIVAVLDMLAGAGMTRISLLANSRAPLQFGAGPAPAVTR